MKGTPGRALFWLLALYGVGCGGESSSSATATPCKTNSDCAPSQTCRTSDGPGLGTAAALPPCATAVACTTSASCSGANSVCAPNPFLTTPGYPCPAMICTTPCTPNSCAVGQRCEDSGVCAYPQCNEPGAQACSEHYRCDPAAAKSANVTALSGSALLDSDQAAVAAQRGCVRKNCLEPGGFTCRSNWRCDPAAATDPSGCVPVPCGETGHCVDDASFTCSPTSQGRRPPAKDVHGCVAKNCAETSASLCVPAAVCDPESSLANEFGCRPGGVPPTTGGFFGTGGLDNFFTGGVPGAGGVPATGGASHPGGSGGATGGTKGEVPSATGVCVETDRG